MTKYEHLNDLSITVNSAFTPPANVLTAVNKARGMLHFIKVYLPIYPYIEQFNCDLMFRF